MEIVIYSTASISVPLFRDIIILQHLTKRMKTRGSSENLIFRKLHVFLIENNVKLIYC